MVNGPVVVIGAALVVMGAPAFKLISILARLSGAMTFKVATVPGEEASL